MLDLYVQMHSRVYNCQFHLLGMIAHSLGMIAHSSGTIAHSWGTIVIF